MNAFFADDYDIHFLASELPGVKIESRDVANFCPSTAGGADQTKWAILQAFKQVSEQVEGTQ
ncbi:MAG: hypothetical protein WBB28_21820 [Crinalium sp.]